MPKKLNALIDDNRVKRLYHVLVDEDLSFTEWLRRQIDRDLEEKERLPAKPKGVGKQRRK